MSSHNLFLNENESELTPIFELKNIPADHKSKRKNPQNDSRRVRNEVLKLRLTTEEKQLISDNAFKADMSITEYIMATVNDSQIIVVDKIPQLLLELLRQGNNLNQLVKIAHQTRGQDISGAEEAVKKCNEAHEKLMKFCEDWDVKLKKSQAKKGE